MSMKAFVVATALWAVLAVVATLLAIVAVVLMADSLFAEALGYIQAACAGWCYALALKSIAARDSACALYERIKSARNILSCLFALEIGAQLIAAILCGVVQDIPIAFGLSFTAGFPSAETWCGAFGVGYSPSISTEFLLDVPLLVLVIVLWAIADEPHDTNARA